MDAAVFAAGLGVTTMERAEQEGVNPPGVDFNAGGEEISTRFLKNSIWCSAPAIKTLKTRLRPPLKKTLPPERGTSPPAFKPGIYPLLAERFRKRRPAAGNSRKPRQSVYIF